MVQKVHDAYAGKHANFRKVDPRRKQTSFCIGHYAGEVTYDVQGFLGRNRSAISPDVLTAMETSNVRRPRAGAHACVRSPTAGDSDRHRPHL